MTPEEVLAWRESVYNLMTLCGIILAFSLGLLSVKAIA